MSDDFVCVCVLSYHQSLWIHIHIVLLFDHLKLNLTSGDINPEE